MSYMNPTPGRIFDPNAEGWKRETRKTSGYKCKQPYAYAFEGTARLRDCGWCDGCIARQKSDHVARLAAQGELSSMVAFLTLTYDDKRPGGAQGAKEFCVEHTAKMIRAIRQKLFYLTCDRLGFTVRQVRAAANKDSPAYDPELVARIRADTPTVVFDRWGETGPNGTRRKHWHMLLFFGGNVEFADPDRPGGTRPFLRTGPLHHSGRVMSEADWPYWPYGNVVCEVAKGQSECVRMARYCGKYIGKSRGLSRAERKAGERRSSVHSGSRGYALGARYFEEEARRYADAGLPLKGGFYVPGVLFSQGTRKRRYSTHERKSVTDRGTFDVIGADGVKLYSEALPARPGYTVVNVYGAVRDHAIAAYKERWRERRPGALIPLTPWLERYDKDFCPDEYRPKPATESVKWHDHGPLLTPLPPYRDPARVGNLTIDGERGNKIGAIHVSATGAARAEMENGEGFWLPAGDLSLTLGRFVGEAQRKTIERWLSFKRGPGWLPKWERRKEAILRAERARVALGRVAARHETIVNAQGEDVIGEMTGLARQFELNGNAYENWLAYDQDASDSDRASKRAAIARWIEHESKLDLTPDYTRNLLARLVGGTCDAREFAQRSKVFRNRWNRLKRRCKLQGGNVEDFDKVEADGVRPFPKPPKRESNRG